MNHRESPEFPLPLPVVGTLIYVGLISLQILYLRALFSTIEQPPSFSAIEVALQLGNGDGITIRRASSAVSVLLVLYLWQRWRGLSRTALTTGLYIGTAALVVLSHLALANILGTVPQFVFTPLL